MPSFIIAILLLCSLTLFSQPAAEPVLQQNLAATVAQCLKDLQSDDLLTRRAAALLIGKYDSPEAKKALLNCLQDEDPGIRQSALVSLTEEEFRLPPETGAEILRLLSDPDVHVRRIASSLLDRASQGNRIVGANIIIRGNLQDNAQTQLPLAEKYLNLALQDEDRSVRRNTLLAAGYFPGLLKADRLMPFLQEDSKELQVLALRALSRCREDKAVLAAQLEALLHSPHAELRRELVNTAANFGEAGLPLLQALAKDPQAAVRLPAIGILARDKSAENLALLKTAVLDENIPAELRSPLVSLLRLYAEQGRPVLEALLQSQSASLRQAALRILALPGGNEDFNPAPFLAALQDSSPENRRLAMSALRRNKTSLSRHQALALLKSKFADLRAFSFQLVEDQALLLEMAPLAILDDEPALRRAALQVYARQKPEDYRDILIAALHDEDSATQELAATYLLPMYRQTEIRAALLEYLPRCQKPQLKLRLQKILK